MIDPTGITTYTYDASNRLTSITNNRGLTTIFTYDALNRRTSMTHGNGVVTTYEYDKGSFLTKVTHQLGTTIINSFSYTYDKVGNRITKLDRNGTYNYIYDKLNRLVRAENPLLSNPLETYTYDAVGNRIDSNQNGTSFFNQGNQLFEDNTFRYFYDNNGNLILKTHRVTGAFTTYEYDAENKLVRVVTPGTTVNYKYDGLGRRVEKEVTQAGVTKVSRFIYDQEDILLELDGSNNITARYTHGPGIDEPLIIEKGDQSFFYHADGLGSITEITDATGAVKQRYTYSSFGKIESQLDPTFVQLYMFTARELDSETGLYHYRQRYYDQAIGRLLQEDPIGGINLYVYTQNNPLFWIDPMGLENVHFLPTWLPTGNSTYPHWVMVTNDWYIPIDIARGSISPDLKMPACTRGCPTIKSGTYPFQLDDFPRNLRRSGQKRYPALRLGTVPSTAPNPNNNNQKIMTGIWIHRGGGDRTFSEGCLAIDPKDWADFMKNFPAGSSGKVIAW